jgi:nucleoside-diphosphate-sugar epimerase
MRFDLTVNEFAHALASNQSLRVFDPDTWRPYCHVKDFARLIKLVIEDKSGRTDFEVFNAGGDGNNATKRTITQLIRKHTSLGAIEFAQNGGDPRNYRVSFKKVRETLGFLPEYDLEYGIKEVIAATVEGVFLDAVKHPTGFGNYVLEKHLTDVLL